MQILCFREAGPKPKRPKMTTNEGDLEEQYESVTKNEPITIKRNLLPIKTKTSFIQQALVKNEEGRSNKLKLRIFGMLLPN